MAEMTWEQKFEAINALGAEASLLMRQPGDWFVQQQVEIGGDGLLRGDYGNGRTPEAAVEAHWRILTSIPAGRYVVVRAMGADRKQFRWNGYRWCAVATTQREDA